ncbi:ATP-binding cassette domain-containing protein [Simiduia sp. 21SJ11W-1]|uniref:molybdenum ABC transporter ATP-binding protein n=1 Tax=Simiduia sp. 21SJ11W-1 TaxID=2909669 RepID=UPI00209E940F|nr:ATP-binding cassette domain-containing protein [Simiduia sp. 21SJ11W-1]UTA48490.1 ATP-binding cassette domain-containing protein [Simiduia sp. 21SJ11W-1]
MNWHIQFTGPRCQHSLALPTRGVSVVFGASGSGKSTLLHALAGTGPQPGTVKFGGQTWQEGTHSLSPRARNLAMVFQEPRLLAHLNAQSNIRLGTHTINPTQWQTVCELLNLTPLLAQPARQLSGGEQQRVALARALLKPASALLLDEPFNGLDKKRRQALLPYIKNIARTQPVLLVTHQLDELLALADYLVLVDGQSSVSGPVAELLNHPLLTNQRGHQFSVLQGTPQPASEYQGLQSFTLADGQTLRVAATPETQTPYLAIDARDVSLALTRATDSSIVNILAATIKTLEAPVQGIQQVHLALGNQTLIAQVSSYSAAHLQLKQGQKVFAQVKSTALLGR